MGLLVPFVQVIYFQHLTLREKRLTPVHRTTFEKRRVVEALVMRFRMAIVQGHSPSSRRICSISVSKVIFPCKNLSANSCIYFCISWPVSRPPVAAESGGADISWGEHRNSPCTLLSCSPG